MWTVEMEAVSCPARGPELIVTVPACIIRYIQGWLCKNDTLGEQSS